MKHFNKLVTAAVVTLLSSGCSTLSPVTDNFRSYTQPSLNQQDTPQQLQLVNVELNLTAEQGKLTPQQSQQLVEFIQQQGLSYKQRIIVKSNLTSLNRLLKPIETILNEQGIHASHRQYIADNSIANGQLTVISEYFQLLLAPCKVGDKVQLGCASKQNLAVSLPDSGQLIRARQAMAADGVKAVNSIQSYRTTEQTNSSDNSDFFSR